MLPPRLGLLVLLSAALPAQYWTVTDPTPSNVWPVVFDPVHRRVIGFTMFPTGTWTFEGTTWRRIQPEDLGGVTPTLAVFDAPRSQAVLVTFGTVLFGQYTYLSSGLGWRRVTSAGVALPSGGSAAFDPIGNRVIAFGGYLASGLHADSMAAWNGAQWTTLAPAVRPAARHAGGLIGDPVRGRVVLFGGEGAGGMLADTWEWDGAQWTQQAPAVSPSARAGELVFDPASQRVVLLGGYGPGWSPPLFDCWSWDGTQWTPRGSLPTMQRPGSGYHDGTSMFVVETSGPANVWRANGSTWTPVWTGSGPTTFTPAFAYDPLRDELLMAGGTPTGDTWAWNGTWQLRSTAGPGPRVAAAMAPLGADMVLFGGLTPLYGIIGETWSWNGQSWTMGFPAQQPSPRYRHAMVGTGSHVLLFGGDGAFGALGDTWQFDGTNWTQLQPATSPPRRFNHGLAHDPLRQRTVLYGGQDWWSQYQDTWEWDGTNWLQRSPATQPAALPSRLAFDTALGRVVLPQPDRVWSWDGLDWFPGPFADNSETLNGALAYHEGRQRLVNFGYDGSTRVYGPTPASAGGTVLSCGARPDLRLFGRPEVGTTSEIHVEGAANSLALLCFSLHPGSTNWAPGCYQVIGPIDAVVAGVLDARRDLSVPLTVPAVLGFRGIEIHAQAVVLDGGPVFGASLSSGLLLLVGD